MCYKNIKVKDVYEKDWGPKWLIEQRLKNLGDINSLNNIGGWVFNGYTITTIVLIINVDVKKKKKTCYIKLNTLPFNINYKDFFFPLQQISEIEISNGMKSKFWFFSILILVFLIFNFF